MFEALAFLSLEGTCLVLLLDLDDFLKTAHLALHGVDALDDDEDLFPGPVRFRLPAVKQVWAQDSGGGLRKRTAHRWSLQKGGQGSVDKRRYHGAPFCDALAKDVLEVLWAVVLKHLHLLGDMRMGHSWSQMSGERRQQQRRHCRTTECRSRSECSTVDGIGPATPQYQSPDGSQRP